MSGSQAGRQKWAVLLVLCLGQGLLMMDLFVVNVALPTIAKSLRAELISTQWIISAYALMLGVLPVAMGRSGDILGRRRVYTVGLLIFVLASLGCAMAWNIGSLVFFRALQGAGGAIMMPLALALVIAVFPARQRGLAIGVWGGISGLGLVAGPLLGGALVQTVDWRWIFVINVPPGVFALLMTRWIVPESRDPSAARQVDWPGAILLTAALLLIMVALGRGNAQGWLSFPVLVALGAGGVLLALFFATERRAAYPLVDPALFRNGTFIAASASTLVFSAAVFGFQPFASLFMQNSWGFSPILTGAAFLPAVVLVAVFLPLSGWFGQRMGSRLSWTVMAGALAVLASTVFLLLMDRESNYWDSMFPALLLRGVGIGIFITTSTYAAIAAMPSEQAGLASGVLTMARQVGTALGVAMLGAVYVHHLGGTALPSGAAEASAAALELFKPFGNGDTLVATQDIVVAGFVRIAWTTALLSALATAAAWFIRHRATQEPVQPVEPAGNAAD